MSDTTRIRIAQQMARELEFEVDDADAAVASIEAAMTSNGDLVWIVDSKGNRHGIAVDKLAFVEVEADDKPSGVGFSASS
jgi:hypothetical protein